MGKHTLIAVLTVFSLASTSYAIDLDDIDWFDLSGWTSIGNGESNFFENVCGEDDLTVTAMGAFALGNQWTGAYINEGFALPNQSHSFRFDYTGSERLVVEILTLDNQEAAEVEMPGLENVQLVSGNPPNVSPAGDGLRFTGIANGFPGVSNFIVYASGPISTVTYTHASLDFPEKYEFVRIGKVIPEPGTFSLLGLALLGIVRLIRRK